MIFLSVDGGGTHGEFTAADDTGHILAQARTGSLSFKAVGQEAALEHMRLGLASLAQSGVDLRHIDAGVWGLSGCDTRVDREIYRSLLRTLGLDGRHAILNDAQLAFYSAAEAPGAVIVAGTGSVAMGFDGLGGSLRCGGWNYAFSDRGSGYWLGARLLGETALWLEGCREDDPVLPRAAARLGDRPQDCLDALSELTDADKIAAFARLAAEQKDSPLCTRLCREAAGHLQTIGWGVLRRMAEQGTPARTLVLSGGLFRSDVIFEMTAAGFPEIPVVRNLCSPAQGGLKLAARLAGEDREEL